MKGTSKQVVVCRCARANVIPPVFRDDVLKRLCASGVVFEVVQDLCELSATRDPKLQRLANSGELRLAACFPRAVRWLFHAGGADLRIEHVELFNMRTDNAFAIAAGLVGDAGLVAMPTDVAESDQTASSNPSANAAENQAASIACACSCGDSNEAPEPQPRQDPAPPPTAWMPWFPVIDYDRCEGCKQCLGFCLFGVFAVDEEGRVEVRNPRNCKTGCPACGRVCPTAAIIFPKYDKRPINGDEVRDADVSGDTVKVDVTSLVDGDVHAKLRQRRQGTRKRFAVGPRSPANPAERAAHLKRLQAELDIPDAVIQSLSPGGGSENDPADATAGPPDAEPQSAPDNRPLTTQPEQT